MIIQYTHRKTNSVRSRDNFININKKSPKFWENSQKKRTFPIDNTYNYKYNDTYYKRKEVVKTSARFNFIIPEELLERIKYLAQKQGYNTTEYILILLRQNADGMRFEELEKRISKLEKSIVKK